MMEWNVDQSTELIIKYLTDLADARERATVDEWLADPRLKARITAIVSRDGFLKEKVFWDEAAEKESHSLHTILAKLEQHTGRRKTAPVRRWGLALAGVAAASLMVFLLAEGNRQTQAIAGVETVATDLQPGRPRATLVLSTGKVLTLDSLHKGEIAREAGTTIEKEEGGVIDYRKNAQAKARETQKEMAWNTLITPRGGTYAVVLPDHSLVYLNSASSLKYPTTFRPLSPRVVELTGEAYFVVKHDPARPFRVFVGNKMVEALGTVFDVNAYADEPVLKATLLEGSIKASDENDSVLLRPGQQVQMNPGGLKLLERVDTENVVAWKNGDFIFNATPIDEVMRQLGRWYNVSVTYDTAGADGGFTAAISRSRPASEVLQALKESGCRFTIIGKNRIEAQAVKK